jgi:hypothetical protein
MQVRRLLKHALKRLMFPQWTEAYFANIHGTLYHLILCRFQLSTQNQSTGITK